MMVAVTDGPYNPSGVLYRKALATQESAKAIASGKRQVTANPDAREADACIIAIVLAHAAVESAWHWEQALAGVGPYNWPGQFEEALADIAQARSRPAPPGLDTALQERFRRLNAWRNFLQHGDPRSRQNLEDFGEVPDPARLTASFATEVVGTATAILDYIASGTGGQIITGPALWIDPCET